MTKKLFYIANKKFACTKRYTILLILCVSASLTHAQSNTFKPEWNIGVNAGATFSSIDFIPRIKTKMLDGKTMGLSIRYISEKNLGLIGELNYVQQGWKQDFVETDSIYAYSRPINYFELPILTHIYFGNKVRFIFNLGPKFSFKVSEKENMNKALSEILASKDSTEISIRAQYGKKVERGFDYGLVIGTGLEVRSKIGIFVLEGRYYFGLADIFNSTKSDYFSRSANRVVSAKLTYFIKAF
jgi:Outer membrane protein beta-barrel domain